MSDAIKSDPKTGAAPFIKGDWDKAVYLDSPHMDNMMTAFHGLAAEFWAMRRRVMVLEHFLEKAKTVDMAAVEAYEPNDAQRTAWNAERDDFIQRIFSVFTRETARQKAEVPTAPAAPRAKL